MIFFTFALYLYSERIFYKAAWTFCGALSGYLLRVSYRLCLDCFEQRRVFDLLDSFIEFVVSFVATCQSSSVLVPILGVKLCYVVSFILGD